MTARLDWLKFSVIAAVGTVVMGCEHRTVVYTSGAPTTRTTYVRGPAQTTRTVYVNESQSYPTALPGAPIRLTDPGEPSNPPATSR